MGLTKNSYGGVDLLATCTDLEKRIAALEAKDAPKVDESKPVSDIEWTPEPPKA